MQVMRLPSSTFIIAHTDPSTASMCLWLQLVQGQCDRPKVVCDSLTIHVNHCEFDEKCNVWSNNSNQAMVWMQPLPLPMGKTQQQSMTHFPSVHQVSQPIGGVRPGNRKQSEHYHYDLYVTYS